MKKIYLDYAAATPLDSAVLEAMQPYLREEFYNPSSIYSVARTTRLAVDNARRQVAQVLGAKPTEIIFTGSGTESINLAIQGVLSRFPKSHWLTTSIEHDAVLSERRSLELNGHKVTTVSVNDLGVIDPKSISSAITDQTVLLSVQLANNEIGTIQPISAIAKEIASIRADRAKRGVDLPLLLHSDAVQAANYLDLSVSRLGVDLLSLSGSKIYGPKGTGVLYVRTGTPLEPLLYGGGQERDRRSGTENVAGIIGFAKALKVTSGLRTDESARLVRFRDHLLKVLRSDVENLIVNGDMKKRLPNNLNLTLPGAEGQALVMYLDNSDILVSTGSACSSGDLDPSHVLLALGRSSSEAGSSLRITLGRQTTMDDVDKLAKVLPQITSRVRSLIQ